MPEYAFYCKQCEKPFTAFMHVIEHDKKVAECPKCHQKRPVEKRLAPVNVFTPKKS